MGDGRVRGRGVALTDSLPAERTTGAAVVEPLGTAGEAHVEEGISMQANDRDVRTMLLGQIYEMVRHIGNRRAVEFNIFCVLLVAYFVGSAHLITGCLDSKWSEDLSNLAKNFPVSASAILSVGAGGFFLIGVGFHALFVRYREMLGVLRSDNLEAFFGGQPLKGRRGHHLHGAAQTVVWMTGSVLGLCIVWILVLTLRCAWEVHATREVGWGCAICLAIFVVYLAVVATFGAPARTGKADHLHWTAKIVVWITRLALGLCLVWILVLTLCCAWKAYTTGVGWECAICLAVLWVCLAVLTGYLAVRAKLRPESDFLIPNSYLNKFRQSSAAEC